MKRDFKGVWIPKEVWLDEKLTWIEKLVFVEIDSLQDGEKGGCYASNRYLGHFFQLSGSRISEIVSNLKKKGYVYVYLVHNPLRGRIETERLIKTKKFTIRKAEGGTRKTGLTPSENQKTPSGNGEYNITHNNTKNTARPTIRPGDVRDPELRKLFFEDFKKREKKSEGEKKGKQGPAGSPGDPPRTSR